MSVALHRKDGDGGNVSKLVREAYKCVFCWTWCKKLKAELNRLIEAELDKSKL
jgi:hypothetical protein